MDRATPAPSLVAERRALLWSGGIGDYLHYLGRLPHLLSTLTVPAADLTIFVESTVPAQVARIFALAFPLLRFEFVPAAIHWTKTNPLLDVTRLTDRQQRPAYRYVRQRGYAVMDDWFLPFCCEEYRFDSTPLLRIVGAAPGTSMPTAVISLRDKGFLWWPTVQVLEDLEALLTGWRKIYFGTPIESLPGFSGMVTATDVAEALAASYWADLFIGTDTGLATIRELTGRKVVYCIDEYWLQELMVRYRYIDPARTASDFVFCREQLLSNVRGHVERGLAQLASGCMCQRPLADCASRLVAGPDAGAAGE